MISRRPSIFIYVNQPDPEFLKQILAGIEEEGISSEVFDREETDTGLLAFEAARDSMMGSGIGICGVDIAMQMRGRKRGDNVQQYHMPTYEECRITGTNSARVIKKLSLKER
ncbi:MAG: glycerol dehydratase reactivase beta/small subunit family protein [Eubacteriales bacterium]|nr:glycerol dehydratase reactivase beta/small subunit family protein [Eubacteriales bacterium]